VSLSSYETAPQQSGGTVQLKTGMTVQQLKELTKKRIAATKLSTSPAPKTLAGGLEAGPSPQSVAANAPGAAAPKGKVYPPGYVPPAGVALKRAQAAAAAAAAAEQQQQAFPSPMPQAGAGRGAKGRMQAQTPAEIHQRNLVSAWTTDAVGDMDRRYSFGAVGKDDMGVDYGFGGRHSDAELYYDYDAHDDSTLRMSPGHFGDHVSPSRGVDDLGTFGQLMTSQAYSDAESFGAFLNGSGNLDVASPSSSGFEAEDAERDVAASVAAQALLAGQQEASWETRARTEPKRSAAAMKAEAEKKMLRERRLGKFSDLELRVDDAGVPLKRADSLGDVAPIIENTAFSVAEFVLHTPGTRSPATSFHESPAPNEARGAKGAASPMMRKAMASPLLRVRSRNSSITNGSSSTTSAAGGSGLGSNHSNGSSGSTLEEVQSIASSTNPDGNGNDLAVAPAEGGLVPPPPPLTTPRGSSSASPASSPLQRMRLSSNDVKTLGSMTNRLSEMPNGSALSSSSHVSPRFFEAADGGGAVEEAANVAAKLSDATTIDTCA